MSEHTPTPWRNIRGEQFVEIKDEGQMGTLYRFYGLGRWMVKGGNGWTPLNAIYIPSRVLAVAAAQCLPVDAP